VVDEVLVDEVLVDKVCRLRRRIDGDVGGDFGKRVIGSDGFDKVLS
jgi:hypothetical protein